MKCNLPEQQKTNAFAEMSLYEINQQLIEQLGEANEEMVADFQEKFINYLKTKKNTYYLLLCKDRSYYTIFKIADVAPTRLERAWNEFNEIVNGIGKFYNYFIDPTNPEGIEVWIKDSEDEKLTCYLFFAYDAGIVEV